MRDMKWQTDQVCEYAKEMLPRVKTYEARRVVVPDGLGVAEGLHDGVGLDDLDKKQMIKRSFPRRGLFGQKGLDQDHSNP